MFRAVGLNLFASVYGLLGFLFKSVPGPFWARYRYRSVRPRDTNLCEKAVAEAREEGASAAEHNVRVERLAKVHVAFLNPLALLSRFRL